MTIRECFFNFLNFDKSELQGSIIDSCKIENLRISQSGVRDFYCRSCEIKKLIIGINTGRCGFDSCKIDGILPALAGHSFVDFTRCTIGENLGCFDFTGFSFEDCFMSKLALRLVESAGATTRGCTTEKEEDND